MTGLIDKFAAFKALHERPQAFVMPNPWNAGTARILATLGFEALATTSAGLAFSIGRRDSAQGLTRQQVLENAKAIVESTDLPVSGDLEDGFGTSPQDCASTIVAASSIGLVGGNIEDATGDPNDPIFAFNHAVERIAAACEAARSLPFVLTARADGLIWGRPDLDETIRRLQAFSKAGAHVLYAPGLSKLEDIRTVCTAVDKPLNVVMGLVGARFSVAELQSTGVKRISVGGSFARVALSAFIGAAREVKDRGTFDYAVDAISDADAAAYMANEKR